MTERRASSTDGDLQEAEADRLREESARYRRAIEVAFHYLQTEHGLWCTDQPQAYADAMQDGLDSEGAFNCLQETFRRLDHKNAIDELNAILNTPIPPLLQAQNDLAAAAAAAQATIEQLKSTRYKYADDEEMVWTADHGWLHQNIVAELARQTEQIAALMAVNQGMIERFAALAAEKAVAIYAEAYESGRAAER
mgnify:CR=1 FL=1